MITGNSHITGVPTPDTLNRRGVGDQKRLYNTDGTYREVVRMLNDTGGATVAGQVCMVGYGVPAASGFLAKTPATSPTGSVELVVAEDAIAFGDPGWFAVYGLVDALVHGTTPVVAGDQLQVTVATSTTAFVDSTAIRGERAAAKAMAAQSTAGAVLTRVRLYGLRVLIV